uniref:Uncharacterized protein n=1 Tax=Cacopsylla melanoneura TaxID=428564 RepID=A0A8D8WRE3_9HEMI
MLRPHAKLQLPSSNRSKSKGTFSDFMNTLYKYKEEEECNGGLLEKGLAWGEGKISRGEGGSRFVGDKEGGRWIKRREKEKGRGRSSLGTVDTQTCCVDDVDALKEESLFNDAFDSNPCRNKKC